MALPTSLDRIVGDLTICLSFYTRLALPARPDGVRGFAAAQWAAPLAGAIVALAAAGVFLVAERVGLPVGAAALAAVATGILLTGGLHEDGLADSADGFGGGATPERRLEIMRDSRIGTFGALAMVLSVMLRWVLVEALATPGPVLAGLVAAHAGSRALLPSFMMLVPPARRDGLSAGAGTVDAGTAGLALALGAAALIVALGFAGGLAASLALLAWSLALARFARRRIGGQTGDVLGALEQGAEIVVLAVASVVLT